MHFGFPRIFVAFTLLFFLSAFALQRQTNGFNYSFEKRERNVVDSFFVCHFSKQRKKQIWKRTVVVMCLYNRRPNFCGFIETTTANHPEKVSIHR
jgi:hypothetical protein